MTLPPNSRRDFIIGGAATLAGAALASPGYTASNAHRGAHPKSPAAAAGTLRLGGELEVHRMGFGAMRITGDGVWGEPKDGREARAVLRRAVELGVNFIDTAQSYGPTVSERLIAEALHPYPAGLVIATKGGLARFGPGKMGPDGRPERLREDCEGSLKRLKLERIDLYQLHIPDPKVPFEDSLGALKTLQQEGKIRFIGISNVNADQLAKAQSLVTVVSVQNRYNVADRNSDPVLAACEAQRIVFLPWGPLAQRAQASPTPDPRLRALQTIATAHHVDLSQAALAWLLARSPVVLPIPGTSRIDHLEENVAAAKLHLTPAEMTQVG